MQRDWLFQEADSELNARAIFNSTDRNKTLRTEHYIPRFHIIALFFYFF